MSGRARGPFAFSLRGILWLASFAYRFAIWRRNRKFDHDSRAIVDCGVPVISVGNLTTGGTGKTPVVCLLAKYIRDRGIRVALVSRGYGRGESDHNDEAEELHQRLPDVPHLQDPDRVASANIAVEELGSQVILMDDGFQHRRLARKLDLVVVDATCPFGFGHLLPRGLLREPVSGLRRADAVLISRCDQVETETLDEIEAVLSKHNQDAPVLRSIHAPLGLLDDVGKTQPIEDVRGRRVIAFCGIGNPDAFRRTVESTGATVVEMKSFPDHAEYDRERIESLAAWARSAPDIDYVVCTHKDLVKIRRDRLGGVALRAVMIEMKVEDLGPLLPLIDAVLP
ncbi:MAG: tetraacyldisaccharide 4'-kinase [Planctomycetota bacterium]